MLLLLLKTIECLYGNMYLSNKKWHCALFSCNFYLATDRPSTNSRLVKKGTKTYKNVILDRCESYSLLIIVLV